MMERSAVISECRRYRYSLARTWDARRPLVVFVGLNPSVADAQVDDPTIRKCIGFAQSWGFGRLVMVNLFAFRATQPKDMKAAADPIGPDNDETLVHYNKVADLVVACWGRDGGFMERDKAVLAMLHDVHCIRVTSKGDPEHPLYLPGHLQPEPYGPRDEDDYSDVVTAPWVTTKGMLTTCGRCGSTYEPKLPVLVSDFARQGMAFLRLHAACKEKQL